MSATFFDEQTDQSQVKTAIVTKYFWAWAKIVTSQQRGNRIGYIDLFSGPGRYKSGEPSTPLLILRQAIDDPVYRERLVTTFNDADPANAAALREEIARLPGGGSLRYPPCVQSGEVDDDVAQQLQALRLIPTLLFADPWGYKGLSLRLVSSVLKDWACECVFFFNYNRVNMGLRNDVVRARMAALFGEARAARLRARLEGMEPERRESAIVEEICRALRELGGRYVLPFCFKNERGTRTSHHLVFVSKHPLGYGVMKEIMARESSSCQQGVASFAYSPADGRQGLLFELGRPLDDLAGMLRARFAGKTLTVQEVFEQHNVDTPYVKANYKDVLREMELAGTISSNPPHSARPRRNGQPTFADRVRVTFPPN